MDSWALPWLEGTTLLLLVWCAADALRRGAGPVLELAAGAFFGMAVEQMAIWGSAQAGRLDAYKYGPFAWMATPDVPLVVVAAWGALLYAAMKYSDQLGIPGWLRPAADGLYALMLDLTMDVVAVGLGLWHWATPPGTQWFGVPFSNYGGWLIMAVLFSAAVRLVRSLAGGRPVVQAALLAGVTAALSLFTLNLLTRMFTGTELDAWPVGLLALQAAALTAGGLWWRRSAAGAEVAGALAGAPPPAPWVDPAVGLPVIWHMTYLALAALTGLFNREPALLFLTGTLAATGMLLVIGILPPKISESTPRCE